MIAWRPRFDGFAAYEDDEDNEIVSCCSACSSYYDHSALWAICRQCKVYTHMRCVMLPYGTGGILAEHWICVDCKNEV